MILKEKADRFLHEFSTLKAETNIENLIAKGEKIASELSKISLSSTTNAQMGIFKNNNNIPKSENLCVFVIFFFCYIESKFASKIQNLERI